MQIALVAHGARKDSMVALFDVNGLKRINDVQGHLAGDELLKMTGEALRTEMHRINEKVFRIGGDEFALICDAPSHFCDALVSHRTQNIANRLRQAVGSDLVGLSVGVARLGETDHTRKAWLGLADARMYADKGARRRA